MCSDAAKQFIQNEKPFATSGIAQEPLLEKEVFETVIPIDSFDEAGDLVAGSVQSELRRNSGRPPGGIQSRNDADTDVGVSERAGTVFKFLKLI